MSVRLLLFGPPRLAHGDGSIALAFERRSQLLAHLALRRSGAPRTELAAMLWPQTPMEQAHANLRKTLFRIRGLPWAPAIAVDDQVLAFGGTSDVADFEAAVAQRRWADALEIAAAPFLAGFDDDASEPWSIWLRSERERLRAVWRAAAQQCLTAATDPADTLALSTRLLADDPLDESALHAQMLAYVQQGQPAQARDSYRVYAAQLADELGATPSANLQALHDTLHASGFSQAGRAWPAVVDGSGLVGRIAERRSVRERLDAGCRLVCLIGPGGVGKSSLARQLSSELAPRYADGSAYVPLDDVASIDAIGARLARELSISLAGGAADTLHEVATYLRTRRMLLVLDNFEHLQAAAPRLQELLDACPGVQILVTSRVRLGLASEQLLPLDGLPCPEAEDVNRFAAFDAVQVFVRAAQAVEPALNPAADAAAIAEICRLVDGLPLALEMAAAWTRVLSCQAIAAELRQGVGLLTERDIVRPARHASMATVFEQSWQQLTPAQRTVWSRLTVFQGGFTPDAARRVTGASLPALAALADQSLLRKSGSRADLHPLLRQLAMGRLTAGEHDDIRAAHAAYYLNWLVPLRHALMTGDKQALQQVDIEFENLRAAWGWASLHGPADALRSTAMPLMPYCELRGRQHEGLALMRAAAAGVGARDPYLGPLLDAVMARIEISLAHFADAQKLAERALPGARATRDHDTRLICFKVLGACALEGGRLQRARRRLRQALAHAPAAIDPRTAASTLQNLANVATALNQHDEARMLFSQALVEQRRIGDVAGEAMCLSNLGWLEMETGRIDVATTHLEAALALCDRHAMTGSEMSVLENLTEVSVRRNDAAAVRRYGQRALELAGRMGARRVSSWLHLQFAQFAVRQHDLPAARDALRAGIDEALASDYAPAQLECVICFTTLLYAYGEPAAAIRLLRYAINHPAITTASRDWAARWLAEWSSKHPEAATLPVPAIDLWTLLHRIVGEAPMAHATLIESLRAPQR